MAQLQVSLVAVAEAHSPRHIHSAGVVSENPVGAAELILL